MNPKLRNVLVVIVGWFGGSVINMVLVNTGHALYPTGIDPNDMEAFKEIMPTLGTEHFVFPLLAHALGTLVGAIIAYLLAASQPFKMAVAVGILFLILGIVINSMLPGPTWFAPVDIILAYLPMAWMGGKIAARIKPDNS